MLCLTFRTELGPGRWIHAHIAAIGGILTPLFMPLMRRQTPSSPPDYAHHQKCSKKALMKNGGAKRNRFYQ
jgi:hypothetical protein